MDQKNNKKPGGFGKNPFDSYRKTDVMTANRETILLMLYAGAIRFMKQAIEAAERNDIAEKTRMMNKAQEIITELRSTLNFEVGGDFARSLDQLYVFMITRLSQAGVDKTTVPLTEVLQILTTLHEGWEQAIESIKKEKNKATSIEK